MHAQAYLAPLKGPFRIADQFVHSRSPAMPSATNGCKILVVDDDLANRETLTGVLEEEGYSVSSAEDGSKALSLLKGGYDPDLILTDLQMPILTGWEFCEALKKSPAWRSIPVVVLAGMTPEQRGQLQVEGAFEKPTDVPTLVHRINELCGV